MTCAEADTPGRRLYCNRCGRETFHPLVRRTPRTEVFVCDACHYRRVVRRPEEKDQPKSITEKMTLKEARIRRAVDEMTTEAVNHFFKNPDAFVDSIPLLESAMNGGPAGPALDVMTKEVVFRFAWIAALQIYLQGLDRWRFVQKYEKGEDAA